MYEKKEKVCMKKSVFFIVFACIIISIFIIFRFSVISNENGYYIDGENNKILFIIEKGDKSLIISTIFHCREPTLYIVEHTSSGET